jgi:hypothetical protein
MSAKQTNKPNVDRKIRDRKIELVADVGYRQSSAGRIRVGDTDANGIDKLIKREKAKVRKRERSGR